MPRPSMRDPVMEEEVLSRLSQGEPLARILQGEGFPTPQAWRMWCHADETLAIAYAGAREAGEDVIAADSLAMLDAEPERIATEHGLKIDPAWVAHTKNRSEHRLKLLAKWSPKRWGERVDVTTGGDKLPPSLDDAGARIAALMALAKERKDAE